MATIKARKRSDGSVSYTAQIRIKKDGVQVYTESQTFVRKKAVEAWAKRRETELSEPAPLGKTKEATLSAMMRTYLGGLGATEITSQVPVDYVLVN